MVLPTDNNVSVKIYNKTSKYTDLEIEIKKMWHLKTTMEPVILREINTLTKYLAVLANMEFRNLQFLELLISLGEYYQCDSSKKKKNIYIYRMHFIITSLTLSLG